MIRAALAWSSYLGLTWLLLVMFCIMPKEALALISPQAYSRVVAQAEWVAYQAASRTAAVSAVSSAAAVASPASIAIRAVTGPVGWAALGIMAGMALYQTYYSSQNMAAVKEAARPAGTATAGGRRADTYVQGTPGSCGSLPNGTAICTPNTDQSATCTSAGPADSGCPWLTVPLGWEGVTCTASGPEGCNTLYYLHLAGAANSLQVSPGADPTVTEVQTYLTGLPATDPNSIQSHSQPLGIGASPDTGATTIVNPVSPTEMPTSVKPTAQVGPTDIKIADHVSPPPGTQTTTPTTQQSTTTTATVTNPDGSKTETKTTTATSSCTAAAGHEPRTMGTVLAEHQAIWNSSGLLGAVNLLKNLTWPTSLPVVDLPSSFFGTQHVDFNQWAWVFTTLRTLVIAVASLAAYRIIFVGGH